MSASNSTAEGPTVFCLDLATQTGWALIQPSGLITSGTVSFKSGRYEGGGMRFLRFVKFLDELYNAIGNIDAVFFEEVRRHVGTDAAHIYGGLLSQLTAWCELKSIPYEGVPVGTIKKHATGKGNGNKQAMIEAAIARGHDPKDDNEADALAILYWVKDNR